MAAKYRKDYLTKYNGIWYFQISLSDQIRAENPELARYKKNFKKSLRTSDLKQAQLARDELLKSLNLFDDGSIGVKGTLSASESFRIASRAIPTISNKELESIDEEISDQIISDSLDGIEISEQTRGIKAAIEREQGRRDPSVDKFGRIDFFLATVIHEEFLRSEGYPEKTIGKLKTARERFKTYWGKSSIPIEVISRRSVINFIAYLREQGYSAKTASNDLSYLGSAFKQLLDEGYTNLANPFRDHRLRNFDRKIPREPFSQDCIRFLLEHPACDENIKTLILLAYYTGARVSEIFNIKVVERNGSLYFSVAEEGGKTKNATRFIPVHSKLLSDSQYLNISIDLRSEIKWPSPSSDALSKRFTRFKKQALKDSLWESREENLVLHSFRHTFQTNLLESGFTEAEYAYIAGISQGSTGIGVGMRVYAHKSSAEKQKTMIESIPTLYPPT